MPHQLAFIHTVAPLIDAFNHLAAESLPEVERLHILDEPLLARIKQRGRLIPGDSSRLATHVAAAAEAGADIALVTCSTISPCVADVGPQAAIPVLKIDEAMFDEAVRRGRRIGVIATNPATMGPTREGLNSAAEQSGCGIEIKESVLEAAYASLVSGDGDRHDQLIAEQVDGLASHCDVVILAQASMARALSVVGESLRPKVLTSPETALTQVAQILR